MRLALIPFDRLKAGLAANADRLRYGVSALDQVALSVFGFALNLLLVRALTATDYGIVSLWMAIGLLTISIQNALVGTPLNVHVQAAPDAAAGRRLAEALAVVNLLTTLLMTAAVAAVDVAADAEWAAHDIATAFAVPLFVTAGLYRAFYRSLAFSRSDMAMLLWVDGPYLAVTTLCLGAMLLWPERFAGLVAAFLAMSLGCVVSQLFLTGRYRGPALHPFRRGWLSEYRQIRHDTGWALIGVITTHLHVRSYLYVAVSMIGLAGMAAINVVGILFRPIRLMVTAWGRTALPELAAQLAAGEIAVVDRLVVRAFAVTAAGSLLWSILLWLGWGQIERHFLVGHYPDAMLLLAPWAIAATFDGVGATLAIALQAAREFKFLAYATLVGAPVTIALTAGAVLWHGYTGTMYGVALGNLVLLAMLIARYWLVRRRMTAAIAPVAAPPIAAAAAPPPVRP